MDAKDGRSTTPRWEIAKDKGSPLFKFRAFDPERDPDPDWQGYAASFLRNGLIYCASPWDFDDPWEGRPAFSIPDPARDPEHARLFIDAIHAESPDSPREEVESWANRIGFVEVARQMQDAHWRDNLANGVFSTAGNAVHPLLWSHYAYGHRGYCWVIDNTIPPFASAAKVDYCPNCPEINWARWKEQDILKLSFLTKAAYWAHQEEYRIILPKADAPDLFKVVPHDGKGNPPHGRFLRVERQAIIGVVFGGGMTKGHRREIVHAADKYLPSLEYSVAGIHRRKYKMEIRPMRTEELAELRETGGA